jgi:hypothetical protein
VRMGHLARAIDWRTAVAGAALIVAILGPPVLVVNALEGDDRYGEESYLWLAPALAIFAAFAVGGWWAARRQPRTPFLHAAVAAVVALVAVRVVRTVVDVASGDGASFPLAFLLLAQIAVSLAVLGAYVAMRRRARTP